MRCKTRRAAHKKYRVVTGGKKPVTVEQLDLFADTINSNHHEQPRRMKATVMTYSEFQKRNYPNV
jgi:hypothetical protein